MRLFDFSLKLKGFPLNKATIVFENIKAISEENYLSYLENKKREIVDYHLQNNSFYKNFIGSTDISDWQNIPILTKTNLQCPLEERLSDGYKIKSVFVNNTSGSSGTPFIFAKDKYCHALTWAHIIDIFGQLGIDFNTTLQARFYGIPLDKKGYYFERLKDYFSNRYRFPIFDLSDKRLKLILNSFRRKKFYYINGYTSSIVLFAKFLATRNLVLTDICPTLKYCIVTSEMLFEDDKLLMEKVFNVPIINEYGASELDVIAFMNTKNEFVVNSKTLFVEIVDDENKPLQLGKSGRILITSLYNKAHPMIRYEIGDVGSLSIKSSPKKPILKQLIGRTNDIAILPSGKTVPGLTFYYVTKSIISNDGNVKEFVIEQTAINSFKITFTSNKDLTEIEKTKVKNTLFEYLEKGLTVTFERVEVLKRSKSGKLKQFVTLVKS